MGVLRFFTALLLCCAFVGFVRADAADSEAAIRSAVQSYVDAFNARDAEKLAAHWSPQAIYMNPITGEQAVGREAITEQFGAIFSALGDAKLDVEVQSIEFVSPNVAIEQGAAQVIRADSEPNVTLYSAVHVKQGDNWLLDRVSEEDQPAMPPSYEHLKELEWMIGTWVDQDEQASVETTCQWTKNQAFLMRSFAVTIGDKVDLSGMQFIGWDEHKGTIRSWAYDSDGGFVEATWTKQEDRWIINAAATLSDGRRSSAINILTMTDDGAFTWESTGRELDGEILPNIEPVKIVRSAVSETE